MTQRSSLAIYGAALGALIAWAIVILLAYGSPELYALNVFGATAAVGAAFGMVVGAAAGGTKPVPSTFGQVRRFLKFAAAGWFGHILVVATAGMVARREFAITDWHVFIFLGVFGAVGIVAGLASSRHRQVVAEREQAIRLAAERQRAEEDLELARQLQRQLLPPAHAEGDGFAVEARNLPSRYVAGDFYDYSVSPRLVRFCIADVSGKGAAAGLLMATTKAMVSMLDERLDPAAALRGLNEQLCRMLPGRQFVALTYGAFSPLDGRTVLANAGMPDPAHISVKGTIKSVQVDGERLPLGIRWNCEYRNAETVLEPGDRLVCFSDGIPEASHADGDVLGYERLAAIFIEGASVDPARFVDFVLERAKVRTEQHELADDCTILVLQRRASAAA